MSFESKGKDKPILGQFQRFSDLQQFGREFLCGREILLHFRISLDCKENLANMCLSDSIADELRKSFL
jgi:hypothetical protein